MEGANGETIVQVGFKAERLAAVASPRNPDVRVGGLMIERGQPELIVPDSTALAPLLARTTLWQAVAAGLRRQRELYGHEDT